MSRSIPLMDWAIAHSVRIAIVGDDAAQKWCFSDVQQTQYKTKRFSQIKGEKRSKLDKQGTPIGAMDILIAEIAIALQATLVTHNVTRIFQSCVTCDR